MERAKVHWSFWVICALGVIWNTMSCMNFLMQMNPEVLSSFPEEIKNLVETRPFWSTVAFAIAVFGGLLGDVLLILRKRLAFFIFIIAVLGVVITNIHTFQVSRSPNILVGSSMSFIIGLFFIWYTTFCKKKSWIK